MRSFHTIFSEAASQGVARHDVQVFISHYFQVSSAQIMARLHDPCVDDVLLHHVDAAIARRQKHEPVAYIIREAGFYGRLYVVRSGVLIPRPETELLIDAVSELPVALNDSTIFDIGVGSGIVGLELARRYARSQIIGWDKSEVAIEVASENKARFSHDHVSYRHADFFDDDWRALLASSGPTIVVSNPPYIRSSDVVTLMPDVTKYEPYMALDGGESGLVFIERLIQEMRAYPVWLCLEIGYDQGAAVADLCRTHGFSSVQVHKDLANHDRVVTGYCSGT